MSISIEFIRQEIQEAAKKTGLKNCRLVIFGSRASGTETVGSDLDLGVWFYAPPTPRELSLFKEALEDSRIPCRVDLVILNDAAPEFVKTVLEEAIPVYDSTSNSSNTYT